MLRFVIFVQPNFVRFNYENFRVEANTLMVFRETYEILMEGEFITLECSMQQLLETCDSLCDSLYEAPCSYEKNTFRMLDFSESPLKAIQFFMGSDKGFSIPFLIHYCLSKDWNYFSSMFFSLMNEGGELIGFMKEHAFNPWPTERYAQMLGLSMKKLNFLFKSRYGITPKSWLKETRLTRACYLLGCTTMSIADVANHCGFSNHAYFSESFRKRFSSSPSQWRDNKLAHFTTLKSAKEIE
ncbi:AraC family transcriptional regulator [Erwinia sp. HR93]|uniref:helix-turn-helix domain-containing protein n=1 Tax=Erwinia sp. HR93 TaxID=3094840 RepID=UPI002ADEBF92|nr:AraC family transcriptional regulator [Erwinia sp. HR93]MEA1063787.1 AraC family transcriptional regulator [Erwinia sp. HR93]